MGPAPHEVASLTDSSFLKTRDIVRQFGDVDVTYAVFMRRPVVFTPKLAVDWLLEHGGARRGPGSRSSSAEERSPGSAPASRCSICRARWRIWSTPLCPQRLGPPCVAAFNAFLMCTDLPYVSFIAMDARHCAGAEMAEMMAYAASVGSAKARRETGAQGFIGNANDATAHYFGCSRASVPCRTP